MGKGIALEFKKRFPNNFIAYKAACDAGQLQLGRAFTYDYGPSAKPRYIVNFPTKNHWLDASHLQDLRSGLESLAAEIDRLKTSSITIPALGCGLGGMDWQAVRKELEGGLCGCKTCKIIVFETRESNGRIQSSRKGNFEIDSVKGTADNS